VVAGEASDGYQVLEQARKGDYDLLLLDIAMPRLNGLDVLKQLKAEGSRLPILMLSMYPEEQYAIRTLKAGAVGYLAKGSPEAVLAGRLEMYARSLVILTFGGGTNEIQRDLIAIFGLGMPRSLR